MHGHSVEKLNAVGRSKHAWSFNFSTCHVRLKRPQVLGYCACQDTKAWFCVVIWEPMDYIFRELASSCVEASKWPTKRVSSKNRAHPLFNFTFPSKNLAPPVGINDLPQSACQSLCPPTAHIWRNNTGGGWAIHYRPYKRHSESWNKHDGDSHAAMTACLRHAWSLFLRDNALTVADCPISGIF